MRTIYKLIQKVLFLYNPKLIDINQLLAFKLLIGISQFLYKNPEYKLDHLVDIIIDQEESLLIDPFLNKNELFDKLNKQLIFTNCFLLLDIIRDLDYGYIQDNYHPDYYLPIFAKDKTYYEFIYTILKHLEMNDLDEQELKKYLYNIRRNKFGMYNFKDNMLKGL